MILLPFSFIVTIKIGGLIWKEKVTVEATCAEMAWQKVLKDATLKVDPVPDFLVNP